MLAKLACWRQPVQILLPQNYPRLSTRMQSSQNTLSPAIKKGPYPKLLQLKKVSLLPNPPTIPPSPNSSMDARWSQAWTINIWFQMLFLTMLFDGQRCRKPLRGQLLVPRDDSWHSKAQDIGFFSTVRTENWLCRTNHNSAILCGHGDGLRHPLYLAPLHGN